MGNTGTGICFTGAVHQKRSENKKCIRVATADKRQKEVFVKMLPVYQKKS